MRNELFTCFLFQCCWALSILTFIGNYEDVEEVMDALRQTFSVSFLSSTQNADETSLYTSAISAWCLLLTVATTTDSFLLYVIIHGMWVEA